MCQADIKQKISDFKTFQQEWKNLPINMVASNGFSFCFLEGVQL